MLESWIKGFSFLVFVHIIFIVAIINEFAPKVLYLLLQVAPFFAAVISAYFASKNKILLATSLAIPTAILSLLVTISFQLFGHDVDFAGLQGGLILFFFSLVYASVLCLCGGFAGSFIAKQFDKKG